MTRCMFIPRRRSFDAGKKNQVRYFWGVPFDLDLDLPESNALQRVAEIVQRHQMGEHITARDMLLVDDLAKLLREMRWL